PLAATSVTAVFFTAEIVATAEGRSHDAALGLSNAPTSTFWLWSRACVEPCDLITPGRIGVEAGSQVGQIIPIAVIDVAQHPTRGEDTQSHTCHLIETDRLKYRLLHRLPGADDPVPTADHHRPITHRRHHRPGQFTGADQHRPRVH